MLLHEGDAAPARRSRASRPCDRLAPQLDVPLVGLFEAGEDPHQRGLAGAVLAEQGVDLARAQHEVDVARARHAAPKRFDTPDDADGLDRPRPGHGRHRHRSALVVVGNLERAVLDRGQLLLELAIASAEILSFQFGLMTTSMPPSFIGTS